MRQVAHGGPFRPDRLRDLRKGMGLSVEQFAVVAGVSPETVRSAEKGARVPSARVIGRIVDAARTTVEYLCPPVGPLTLRDLRRRADGRRQRDVAADVPCSVQMVSKVECGLYGVRDPDAWAHAYRTTREEWTAAWEAGRAARREHLTRAMGETTCQSDSPPESRP